MNDQLDNFETLVFIMEDTQYPLYVVDDLVIDGEERMTHWVKDKGIWLNGKIRQPLVMNYLRLCLLLLWNEHHGYPSANEDRTVAEYEFTAWFELELERLGGIRRIQRQFRH